MPCPPATIALLVLIAVAIVGCDHGPRDLKPPPNDVPTRSDPAEPDSSIPNATAARPRIDKPEIADLEPPPPPRLETLPPVDEGRIEAAGLRRLAAGHWEIITDLPPEEAEPLLLLGVEAWPALAHDLGVQTQRGDRVRAMVMQAPERFAASGLLPADLPERFHGRIRGSRFWMRAGRDNYYRSHLFLHEFVHVFLSQMRPETNRWPVAALEGFAESWAVHRRRGEDVRFDAFPDAPEHFAGFGRIERLRSRRDDWPTVPEVLAYTSPDFASGLDPYAFAWLAERNEWALQIRTGRSAADSHAPSLMPVLRANLWPISRNWDWLRDAVDYGVDPVALAPIERPQPVDRLQIVAARAGWQRVAIPPSGVAAITATGVCRVATGAASYPTGPDGIRLDRFGGHPIGCLIAAVAGEPGGPVWSEPVAIGRSGRIAVTPHAELYVRINAAWDQVLAGEGSYTVTVSDGRQTD